MKHPQQRSSQSYPRHYLFSNHWSDNSNHLSINVSSATPFHSGWFLLICAAKADLDVFVFLQSSSGQRKEGPAAQWISLKCFLLLSYFVKTFWQIMQRNPPSTDGTVFASKNVRSIKFRSLLSLVRSPKMENWHGLAKISFKIHVDKMLVSRQIIIYKSDKGKFIEKKICTPRKSHQ